MAINFSGVSRVASRMSPRKLGTAATNKISSGAHKLVETAGNKLDQIGSSNSVQSALGSARSAFNNNVVGTSNINTRQTSYQLTAPASENLNKFNTVMRGVNTAVNGLSGSLNSGAMGQGSTAMYGTIGGQPGGSYSGGFTSQYNPSLNKRSSYEDISLADGLSTNPMPYATPPPAMNRIPSTQTTNINKTLQPTSNVARIRNTIGPTGQMPQNANMTGGPQMPVVPVAQRQPGTPGAPGWNAGINKPLPQWAVSNLASPVQPSVGGAPSSPYSPIPLTPKQQAQVQSQQQQNAASDAAYAKRLRESGKPLLGTTQQEGPASPYTPPNKRTGRQPGSSDYLSARDDAIRSGVPQADFDRQWFQQQEEQAKEQERLARNKRISDETKAHFEANPMPKRPPRPKAGGKPGSLAAAAQSALAQLQSDPSKSGPNYSTQTPM